MSLSPDVVISLLAFEKLIFKVFDFILDPSEFCFELSCSGGVLDVFYLQIHLRRLFLNGKGIFALDFHFNFVGHRYVENGLTFC